MDAWELAAFDKGSVHATLLGTPFRFLTGHGLFSADRVDDGTRLLLEHLPKTPPKTVLDMGCGYGALGLPVAARFPNASCLLVDRDVLAASYSAHNARSHNLSNATAIPSLGYRDVGDRRFSWVLCNIPARIGPAGIAYLMGAGAALLEPGGDLRVVVIRDLDLTVEEMAAQRGWHVHKVVQGDRHSVWSMEPRSMAVVDHEALYVRDLVQTQGSSWERPHDVGEDPGHLREGMPLLLECLPKAPKGRAIICRGGYGVVAATLAARGAQVLAVDKDLLSLAFTARNAAARGLTVETQGHAWLPSALAVVPKPSWVIGEMSSTGGPDVARAEMLHAWAHLPRGTEVLWLSLNTHAKPWLEPPARKLPPAVTTLAKRGAWSVLRLAVRGAVSSR